MLEDKASFKEIEGFILYVLHWLLCELLLNGITIEDVCM